MFGFLRQGQNNNVLLKILLMMLRVTEVTADDTEDTAYEESSSSGEDYSSDDDTRSNKKQLRKGRLYKLQLQLEHLRDNRNNPRAKKRISKALKAPQYENHGYIYIYTLDNGDIKIGRTAQTDPAVRWKQQTQYPEKNDIRSWKSRCHVLAETLIMNYLDFARKKNEEGNYVEEFDGNIVDRSQAELTISKIVDEIDIRMKEIDHQTRSSSLYERLTFWFLRWTSK